MRVTDHGAGVWSIPVPIPDNPLGHTLVHVLETGRGPVLIDTGWDDPASYDVLERGLEQAGTRIADVHGVLVTHHHPDHHGLSGKVREASGAWIAMHAADAGIVRRARSVPASRWFAYIHDRLAASGAPEEHLAPLRAARDSGPAATMPGMDPAIPDREIVPGELLDLPGRRLRAIWTPGHTPGHVCLHLEEGTGARRRTGGPFTGGRLFSGDHLLPRISPHIGLYEDPDDTTVTDPLGDYLDSLERIAALAPSRVLPAHEYAFDDAVGRVRELLDHHERRLARLHGLLAQGPRTPWRLASEMEWNRPWESLSVPSRNIAVSEVSSHLRRLVKTERAEQVPGDEPVRYRAL